jgi:hypothetical protein
MRPWRVRVGEEDYGRRGVVYLRRGWFKPMFGHQDGIRVATVDLTREDAEEQLAEARAKARSLRLSLEEIEAA